MKLDSLSNESSILFLPMASWVFFRSPVIEIDVNSEHAKFKEIFHEIF